MNPRKILIVTFVLFSFGLLWNLPAKEQPAPDSQFQSDFDNTVQPFLDNYCTGCHSGDEPEAGMPLDHFESLIQVNANRPVWLHVVEKINGSEMPPEDEIQPTKDEKKSFLAIINRELDKYDCTKHQKPGRVTVRRLNRIEYNNTIHDLFGVDFQPANDFPADNVGGGFDNIAEALSIPPLLMEKYLEAAERITENGLPQKVFVDAIVKVRPSDEHSALQAAKINLEHIGARAFRRPIKIEEITRLVKLFQVAREADKDFESSVAFAVQAILVSPHFLFRIEFADGEDIKTPRQLNDFELATRLSYFLWSSMPDEQLFELARAKRLTETAVLQAQIRRMLADEKSQALVSNFAGQWLELRNLAKLTPSKKDFPSFDESLRSAMVIETEMLFRTIIDKNRSVMDFIDCDYTFVNERLAKHYGIAGVVGPEFQRVVYEDRLRGGILTHASILTLTSNPTRTSPVKRGKWILDNLLGEPPPPPPPGVEELVEGNTELLGTLRERMQQHRENPSCAVCHNKMDALGFGFENFDGIGKWRDRDGRTEIDASGELPGKVKFHGPAELRKILKTTKKKQFLQCLSGKMLTYAIGRELTPDDRCTTDMIVKALEGNEYRFYSLVEAIVTSKAFRMRGELGEK